MLVLTRRKNQRVSFPGLGISVQIVEVRGKQVRLGIQAPNEIRIVRDELEIFDEARCQTPTLSAIEQCELASRQLATANLAIHLAANQLRQGKTEQAELALEEAVRNLSNLENRIQSNSMRTNGTSVRESASSYQVEHRSDAPMTGLLLEADQEQQSYLERVLGEHSVRLDVARRGLDYVSGVGRDGRWPEFVMMPVEADDIGDACDPISQLGQLQRQPEQWLVNGSSMLVWTRNGFPTSLLQEWLQAG